MTGIWLDTTTVARLLGVTERIVRQNAEEGKYGQVRYESQGRGRPGLRIALDSLPEHAQIAYFTILRGAAGPEPTRASLAELSERMRREIVERSEILDAWRTYLHVHEGEAGITELTERFAAEYRATHPGSRLSVATLYRWDARRREDPALLARQYNRDRGGPDIPPRVREAFLALYLDQSRRSVRLCRELVLQRARAERWPELEQIPHTRTFERFVTTLAKPIIVYYREGPKAYEDKCAPHLMRDYKTVAPGEVWVADHHQLDFAVQGPDGKPAFPWVTAWMDVRSRLWLGWVISFRPNSDTVLLSFHRAVRRYGLPAEIYIDNGKDFRARDIAGGRKKFRLDLDEARIKSLTALLGIKATFAQPYNAKAKPIERAFLTFKEWFSKLVESYRGGNVAERPERLAGILKDPDKLMIISDLEPLYSDWVETVYNEHPHTGQGMDGKSPRQVYDELCQSKRVAPEAVLRLALMRSSQPLKVGRQGIQLHGRYYRSDDLMMRQGEQVYVRYDPAEPGIVHVFDLQDRYICQATNREMVAWHATSEDIRAAKSEAKRKRTLVRQYREALEASAAEPDPLRRVIERRKAAQAPAAKPDIKVLEPVRVGLELPGRARPAAPAPGPVPAPASSDEEIIRADLAARRRAREAALAAEDRVAQIQEELEILQLLKNAK